MQVLSNRYELIEVVGTGGMATVYKAYCRSLDRIVAVKILKKEFVNDQEFVDKFVEEAKNAAKLSHPNIVSIYDVGNDGDIYYIVMEYIDGCTLKELIDSKGRFTVSEALKAEIQIASGIEFAHKNKLIHRDIKPHNIIVTKDGNYKVADFGIAKAVSTSTIQVQKDVIGSVHYLSPEQARGGFIDEKSDVYSLGVILYEMLTGKVPFDGENAVGIAMQHLNDNPVKPSQIYKDIPGSVCDIVMRAMRKDLVLRYQTVSEMIKDMKIVSSSIIMDGVPSKPQPVVVPVTNTANYKKDFADLPKKPVVEEETENEDDEPLGKKLSKAELEAQNKKEKRTRNIMIATIVGIVLVCLGIIFTVFFPVFKGPEKVMLEDYTNDKYTIVKAELETKGLQVKQKKENSSDVEKGRIISQDPVADTEVDKGSTVTLVVSQGEEKIYEIPDDLVSKTYDEAKGLIEAAGFINITEKRVKNNDVMKDRVIEAKAVDSEGNTLSDDAVLKPDTPIVIFVSDGKETVKVPNLANMTYDQAKAELENDGLKLASGIEFNEETQTDKVISQSPAYGTDVEYGSEVTITFKKKATPKPDVSTLGVLTINWGGAIERDKEYYINQGEGINPITVKVELQTDDGKTTEVVNKKVNVEDIPLYENIEFNEKDKPRMVVKIEYGSTSDIVGSFSFDNWKNAFIS